MFQRRFALVAHNEWKINSISIKTAFLQGEELENFLFYPPPQKKKSKYIQCLVLKKMSIWLSQLVNAS